MAYKLLEFPDVIGVVALPWARSAPILGLVLLAVLTLAVLQVIAAELRTPTDAQLILLILVCMVAVPSLSYPPRYETRYVFFLYPAAVAVAVAAVARFLDARFSDLRISPLATLAVVAAGFAVTGDLQPHRMLNIDSEAANFGLGLRPGEKSNLLNRSDPRGAANWLTTNVRSANAMVVNAYPGVDFYYRDFDYAYIDSRSRRYGGYACNRGTVERWGNLPLVSSVDELKFRIAGNARVYIVAETSQLGPLVSGLAGSSPRLAWTSIDGAISILAVDSAPAPH